MFLKTIVGAMLLGCLVWGIPKVAADPGSYLLTQQKSKPAPKVKMGRRALPSDSQFGILSPITNPPKVTIDGDEQVLAFNARIHDAYNRIVQSGFVHEKKRIRYTVNNRNQIDRVWILFPEEQ